MDQLDLFAASPPIAGHRCVQVSIGYVYEIEYASQRYALGWGATPEAAAAEVEAIVRLVAETILREDERR